MDRHFDEFSPAPVEACASADDAWRESRCSTGAYAFPQRAALPLTEGPSRDSGNRGRICQGDRMKKYDSELIGI